MEKVLNIIVRGNDFFLFSLSLRNYYVECLYSHLPLGTVEFNLVCKERKKNRVSNTKKKVKTTSEQDTIWCECEPHWCAK